MTVSTTSTVITSLGNGSTTAWSFPFIGVAAEDLLVEITDSNGDTNPLSPTQYSVSINTPPIGGLWGIGGTVTYPLSGSPLAAGKSLTISRILPYTQTVSISNQGAFYPQAVEQAMDKLELQLQQIKTVTDYSLKFPLSGPVPDDLPGVEDRADMVLGFDSSGQVQLTPNQDITITVNTNTQVKDSFSQPALAYQNTPPGSPSGSDRYLIGNVPTGAWAGKAGLIAEWDSTIVTPAWTFSPTPKQGQVIYNSGAKINYVYRNTWWNKALSDVPDSLYQDFADVPNNTHVNGLVLASGHTLSPEGAGAAATLVNNGRIEPTDNLYNVVLYPYRNLRMAMKYAWRPGHSGDGGVTLAAGTKVAGAIITKMNHVEYLYQDYGNLSIWGGPRRTIISGSPLPYLATAGVQYHYRALDANYALSVTGDIQYAETYINGNTLLSHADYGRFTDSYTDDMISGSCGDDASGNLGYLYFQTGAVSPDSFLPYVYMIMAEPVPSTEDLPNPLFIPSTANLPQSLSATLNWGGGAQEVCRFTPTNYTSYSFKVDATTQTVGTIPGFALATRSYIINISDYNATITVGSLSATTELQTSQNAPVAAVSNAFTIGTSGTDVILYGNPTRTGTDATSTNLTTYTITAILGAGTFVA